MLAGLVDVDVEGVSVGMPVEVVFDTDAESLSIPRFRPRDTEQGASA